MRATLTSTSGLVERARELGEIMEGLVAGNGKAKGKRTRKAEEKVLPQDELEPQNGE